MDIEPSGQSQDPRTTIVDPQFKDEIQKLMYEKYSLEQFQELLVLFQSHNILNKHKGIIGIRKILSIENSLPTQMVINSGILPIMVRLLRQDDYPQLQREAAWIFTNVAAGTTPQCKVIVDLGVIPIFVNMLGHPDNEIVEQAIWGIGNIASDCTKYRDAIIKAGGITSLIKIANKKENPNLMKNCAWALSNLCRSKPLPQFKFVAEAIPVLCGFIVEGTISDKTVLADCCWGITSHSDKQEQIDTVVNSGVVPFLAKLLEEKSVQIVVPALRTLGNISTGNAQQTDVLLQSDFVLPRLEKLLLHQKTAVVRETCWLLSNVAAGTKMQVDALIKNQSLINNLVQLFSTAPAEIKKEVCFIFSNICHHGNDPDVFSLIKEHSLLPRIVGVFESENAQAIKAALECLKGILQQGEKNKATPENPFILEMEQTESVTKLEKLQYHNSNEVYQKSIAILEAYFETA